MFLDSNRFLAALGQVRLLRAPIHSNAPQFSLFSLFARKNMKFSKRALYQQSSWIHNIHAPRNWSISLSKVFLTILHQLYLLLPHFQHQRFLLYINIMWSFVESCVYTSTERQHGNLDQWYRPIYFSPVFKYVWKRACTKFYERGTS